MIPRIPTADMADITSRPTFTSATYKYLLNGITANAVSPVKVDITGASQKMDLSAPLGMISSLMSSFKASAIGCKRPCGPVRMGPSRTFFTVSCLLVRAHGETALQQLRQQVLRLGRSA